MNHLARSMRVPVNRITDICSGKRAITADTAMRLGIALGTSASVWLGLQMDYDLDVAEDLYLDEIKGVVEPLIVK